MPHQHRNPSAAATTTVKEEFETFAGMRYAQPAAEMPEPFQSEIRCAFFAGARIMMQMMIRARDASPGDGPQRLKTLYAELNEFLEKQQEIDDYNAKTYAESSST